MTTLQKLEIRVARLEERTDNQREDIQVIGSEISKVLVTQGEILKVQRTHTLKIDVLDEKFNELAAVVGGHSETLAEHGRTLAKHTRMFETLFAHFGIPLPAEEQQHN